VQEAERREVKQSPGLTASPSGSPVTASQTVTHLRPPICGGAKGDNNTTTRGRFCLIYTSHLMSGFSTADK
jgi:hypothetical protein